MCFLADKYTIAIMKDIILEWRGPFGIRDTIPKEHRGWPGIYLVEAETEILYVGIAETEGAHKRSKDHFRGQGDSIGRWILQGRDASQIHIWVARKSWNKLLIDAEGLLIYSLKPVANVEGVDSYHGKPICIKNMGSYPERLTKEIQYNVDRSKGPTSSSKVQ